MIKVSRSAIEQYLNCKRCFVLQYKHYVRLRSLPFTLNSAVTICVKMNLIIIEKTRATPIIIEHNIDAVPFKHKDMDRWRNNRQGVSFIDEVNKFHFYGAVDDVWVKPNGELIISDVKSTSKKEFNWDKTWAEWDYPKGYKRQLEMYQWLFRKNGFQVSNKGYLVYYNGLKEEPMFNQTLKFELHVVELDCDDSWVEETILKARDLLNAGEYPGGSKADTAGIKKMGR